jgi:hypothetical protein
LELSVVWPGFLCGYYGECTMNRVVYAFVLAGLLGLFASLAPRPAAAGDYYDGRRLSL